MKHVIKLTTIKGVTVEARGRQVAVELSTGLLSVAELLDPHTAGVLGEALVMEATRAQAARDGALTSAEREAVEGIRP